MQTFILLFVPHKNGLFFKQSHPSCSSLLGMSTIPSPPRLWRTKLVIHPVRQLCWTATVTLFPCDAFCLCLFDSKLFCVIRGFLENNDPVLFNLDINKTAQSSGTVDWLPIQEIIEKNITEGSVVYKQKVSTGSWEVLKLSLVTHGLLRWHYNKISAASSSDICRSKIHFFLLYFIWLTGL